MAETDGRVKIDTNLDTKGFIKGTEKLKKAINGLASGLEEIGAAAASGFSDTSQVIEFYNATRAADDELKELQNRLDELSEKEIFTDNYRELQKSIEAAEKKLEVLKEQQKEFATEHPDLKKWFDLRERIEDVTTYIKESRAELKRLSLTKGVDSDSYKELAEDIKAAGNELTQLKARQKEMLSEVGMPKAVSQYDAYQKKIIDTTGELTVLQEHAKSLSENGAHIVDKDSITEYTELKQLIDETSAVLERNKNLIDQEAIAQQLLNVQIAQEKVETANNAFTRADALRNLEDQLRILQQTAGQNITPTPDGAAVSGWQRLGSAVKSAGDDLLSIGKVGAKIGKTFFGAIVTGAKKAIGALGRFRGQAKGAGNSVQTLLRGMRGMKQMLISRVKRTFISYLFSTITESIKALAKFDSRFDESVSNLRNRTSELGANLTAAFGGLVRQIEPIITKIIDAASMAVEKFNALLARLRGETTMQVAVRQTDSYAKSLDNAASEADKAKKAQQRLNATLSSYDEIHKLEADNAEEAADADAASAEKQVFQTVPVESILGKMGDFGRGIVDRIVAGISNGDWFSAGAAISDGLNSLIGVIDTKINEVRPKAEAFASNLGEGIAGVFANFDGYALGKTLADAINLAVGTAGAFLRSLTDRGGFQSMGTIIAEGINGLFTNVDWAGAAHTISLAVVSLLYTLVTAVEETDWSVIGASITEFLWELDWAGAASAISEGLGAAIGSVGQLIRGVIGKLTEKGEDLGESLFEEYGEITGVAWLDGILAALMGLGDWILDNIVSPFVEGIAKACGIDVGEGKLYETGKDVMAGFLEGCALLMKDIGDWIKDNIFDPFIKGIKKIFGISSPAKKMKPFGDDVGQGLLDGIADVFSSIGTWVKDKIFTPISNGLKNAFSIVGDKAEKFKTFGTSIANGVKNGISSGWSNVTGFFAQKAGELETAGNGIVESLKTGISSKWDGVKQWANDKLGNLIDKDTNIDVSGVGESIADGLKAGIGSKWDGVVEDIWSKFGNLANWIRNEGKDLIRSSVEEATYAIEEATGNSYQDTMNTLNAGFDGSNIAESEYLKHVSQYYGANLRTVQTLSSTAEKELTSVSGNLRTVQTLASSVKRELSDTSGTVAATVSGNLRTVQTIASSVGKELSDTSAAADTTVSGLDAISDRLSTIAEQLTVISKVFTGTLQVSPTISGAIVPARTAATVTTSGSSTDTQLLAKLVQKIDELEAAITSRPIRVESSVNIDKREVGRAVAEYTRSNDRIGNGGAYR